MQVEECVEADYDLAGVIEIVVRARNEKI